MKTIELKMRDSPNRERYAGQRGDHRMVKLVIPLPKERLHEIQSCIALFSCDNELALSPLILPGDSGDCYIQNGKVYIVLWQRLPQCWVLRVQLECFGDYEGTSFIDRTEISEKVVFGKSLSDSLDHIPELDAQPSAITQLLASMHRHGNMTILEEFGDLAGDLTYRGEPLLLPREKNEGRFRAKNESRKKQRAGKRSKRKEHTKERPKWPLFCAAGNTPFFSFYLGVYFTTLFEILHLFSFVCFLIFRSVFPWLLLSFCAGGNTCIMNPLQTPSLTT